MALERQLERKRPPEMILANGQPYQLDSGLNVEIRFAKFTPHENGRTIEAPAKRAIVVMPGWVNTRLVTMNELTQAFADTGVSNAYLLNARVLEQANKAPADEPNYLYE